MARNQSTVAMAKKRRPRRVGRPLLSGPPLPAHPRLIHGFLVRLQAAATPPRAGAQPATVHGGYGKGNPRRDSDAKHEGPAEDVTFH